MKNKCIGNCFFFCLGCFLLVTEALGAEQRVIAEGDWKISYQEDSKTCDIVYKEKTILADVFVQAKNKDEMVRSTECGQPVFSKESVTDVFGSGQKYMLTYAGQNGRPGLQQVFYFYPEKSYFLTEAYLVSDKETSSNYIAPIVTSTPASFLNNNSSNRVLSVPFDNDDWVGYSSFPLTVDSVSFEVTSLYCGDTREGLVIGSVEHDTWKTGIRYSTTANQHLNRIECFGGITHRLTRDIYASGSKAHGSITGTKLKSPKLLVGLFDDWRKGLETYGEANALVAPPRKWTKGNIFGWNSWGAMADKLNFTGVLDVSDYIKANLQSKGFTNNGTTYVILDSYWDNLTDYQLKAFAKQCVANGQIPGIYWSPFSDWGEDGNRTMEGGSYTYKEAYIYVNGQVKKIASRALDPTHPGTRQRMKHFIDRFRELGFQYIKLDFLNNGIQEADSYYDKKVTTGVQAYNNGMKYLTELCGDDMFMALSIAPAFPAQYGNSRRISCDAWGAKEDSEYVMNSLSFGWWLDRVYTFNDADHLVLHKDAYTGNENRTRITTGVITGTYILGDNFSQQGSCIGSPEARKKAEKYALNTEINEIAKIGKSFYPVEGYLATGKNGWGRNKAETSFMLHTDRSIYVAIFNYTAQPLSGKIDVRRLGISAAEVTSIKELWSDKKETLKEGSLSYIMDSGDAKVYKIEKGGADTASEPIIETETRITGYVKGNQLIVRSETALKTISVFSAQGALIKTVPTSFLQQRYEVNISDLPKGVFFVHMLTADRNEKNLKFIR